MVTVRLFAAAREAAGTSSVALPAGTIAQLATALAERFGPTLERVLGVSSIMVAGERLAPESHREIPPGTVVDVLPPFAGG